MSCKSETTTIGSNEYRVNQWPAMKSITMKLKLTELFGPSITSLGSLVKSDSGEINTAEALSIVINNLFKNGTPEDLASMLEDCVTGGNTFCNGERVTISKFEEIFSGDDLLDVYKVFFFVMKVNYGNLMRGQFLEEVLAKVNRVAN